MDNITYFLSMMPKSLGEIFYNLEKSIMENITELRINGEVVTDLLGVNLSAKEEETV